jgi:hypothetical protein
MPLPIPPDELFSPDMEPIPWYPVEESCPEVFESDELPPRGSEPPWAPGNAGKSSDVIVNSAGSELFLFTMPTVIRKFDIP